jgi:polyisoprenoid-binding protein YceI
MKSWKRWVIGAVVALGLGVGVGPYVYFHFIAGEAPAPLTISSSPPTATGTTASGSVDGTWSGASGSVGGYRVEEVIFGRSNTAAGRTSALTGSVEIDGTTVASASFSVDMATVTSDENRRDGQFRGRIMDVASFPTSTFELTQPITLAALPAEGVQATAKAVGELTLHGTTKTVTVTLHGVHNGGVIEVSGSIPIIFAEWNIPNPSNMFAQTRDNGTLEFLLKLTRG